MDMLLTTAVNHGTHRETLLGTFPANAKKRSLSFDVVF